MHAMRPVRRLVFLAMGCSGLTGCLQPVLRWVGQEDYGVPLRTFQARDRAYFPKFVGQFFPGVRAFRQLYPTVAGARQGLKLIEVRQLNQEKVGYNEANLAWSADGVYLSYEVVTPTHRKIRLKSLADAFSRDLLLLPSGPQDFLDGMVVRSVHSYNAGLRWSRDSTRYAFMSNGGIGEYNIYVGAVGGKEKAVAQSPTKDGYATWSPRTNEIAFVSARTGQGDIYIVDLRSQALTQISSGSQVDIFPEWFPDGRRIIYASGDASHHNLYTVTRNYRLGWQPPQAFTDWIFDDLRPTISPDGRLVAFYANSGPIRAGKREWNIHVVPYRRDHTYSHAELARSVAARNVVINLNTGPAWSPDGRKLFYVKRDPGKFNPINAYDLYSGERYALKTGTRMNRDIMISRLGILSFRAQVGVWDRVFVALSNQGLQLQGPRHTLDHERLRLETL